MCQIIKELSSTFKVQRTLNENKFLQLNKIYFKNFETNISVVIAELFVSIPRNENLVKFKHLTAYFHYLYDTFYETLL